MMTTGPVTTYEVWQHSVTRQRWLVRVEYAAITGLFGPLPAGPLAGDPALYDFEEHPDDLEWIIRAAEKFTILAR
jgi:hypothetical protein